MSEYHSITDFSMAQDYANGSSSMADTDTVLQVDPQCPPQVDLIPPSSSSGPTSNDLPSNNVTAPSRTTCCVSCGLSETNGVIVQCFCPQSHMYCMECASYSTQCQFNIGNNVRFDDMAFTMPTPSSLTQDVDKRCIICTEDYHLKPMRTLGCMHMFHAECVADWMRVNPICPVCKKSEPDMLRAYNQIMGVTVPIIEPIHNIDADTGDDDDDGGDDGDGGDDDDYNEHVINQEIVNQGIVNQGIVNQQIINQPFLIDLSASTMVIINPLPPRSGEVIDLCDDGGGGNSIDSHLSLPMDNPQNVSQSQSGMEHTDIVPQDGMEHKDIVPQDSESSKSKQCENIIASSGVRCKNSRMRGSDFCYAHRNVKMRQT